MAVKPPIHDIVKLWLNIKPDLDSDSDAVVYCLGDQQVIAPLNFILFHCTTEPLSW